MTPEERFDRMEGALRDLIVVSRTVLTSIQEMRDVHQKDHDKLMAEIQEMREAQSETGEKLNILVNTVDRIIRERNNQPGL
jgi:uncharacterized coiled-coil DUF342 family protein